MRPLSLLLLLVACDDDGLVVDGLPVDAAPPPLVLTVSAVTPGGDVLLMADGAVPPAPRLPGLRLLGASLSLGSGASLGPEGPSVESGGNLGLWVGLRGRLPPESQKALVAAGVAAGLAAGFKAPIAGVFFAF